MNIIKKSMFYIFAIFIFLGIYHNITQQNSQETKNVNYNELKQVIVENKENKEDLTLYQKEDGTLILTKGNTTYITQVHPNDSVESLYKDNDVQYKHIKEVGFLESFFKIAIPIFLVLLIISFFVNRNQGGGMGRGADIVKKNTKKTDIPKTTLKDVGGLSEETRGKIEQIIDIFKNKEDAKALGIRPAKGALFYGPPGTGKTLLAKAVAHELGANFYSMSGSSFVEMFVGVGAKRVRELFDEARKNAPALIFIDEIDSVAKRRGTGHSNEERESTLNELLKQMDGVESNESVFLIAATNMMEMLDPAILRPGRFDYKIMIGLPDLEGRKEIVKIHSKNKKISEESREKIQNFIADATIGCSGAEIEGVFNEAAKRALKLKKKEIDIDDIHYALDVMILGESNRKLNDEDTKKRVAYHEAGHALVGLVTKPKSVRKATIIPRGQALGYVAPISKEMELSTSSELINRISMILAGGVAEMKKFGEHSIGVGGDVEQAKNIIGKMVDLGMKDGDFVLTFSDKEKQEVMKSIYDKSLENCKKIMAEYEEQFETLTQKLLEKETLSGEEIERIIYNLPDPEVAKEKTEEVKEEVEVKEEEQQNEKEELKKNKGKMQEGLS